METTTITSQQDATRKPHVSRKLTHTGDKPHKCDYPECKAAFARPALLARHNNTHTGEKPYACNYPECNAAFAEPGALISHNRRHTGERPYVCDFPDCNAAFAQSGGLNRHKRIHVGEKPYACDFPECNGAFSESSKLTIHQRTHTGEKPHACDYPDCNSAFVQLGTLNTHKRRHIGEKPHKCDFPECNAAFADHSALIVHKRRQHTGQKPYMCGECNAAFVQSGELTTHHRTHTGDKPYVCNEPECERKFVQSSHLRDHQQREHLGKCQKCLATKRTDETAGPVHFKFAADRFCMECGIHAYGGEVVFRAEYRMAYYLTKRFANHPAVLKIYLNKQDPDDDKCSKRRPDVRILAIHGTAISECDENQHRASEYTCLAAELKDKWSELQDLAKLQPRERRKISEDARLSEIVNSGSIEPTVVWRLNPDAYRDEEGAVVEIAEACRLEALGDEIERWLDQKWIPEHFIQVVYLYYDGAEREEDFVPIDGEEYRSWLGNLQAPKRLKIHR